MPRSSRPALSHVPALDGIRGAGVAGILVFHAGYLDGGWLGVDLFFVLSGFLITSLLVTEFDASGTISLPAFWGRRARRLFPALFAALLGVAVYTVLFASVNERASIRADGFATLFYVANWHAIYAAYDYWALFVQASPLEHTWSLAIEEQFYLFWPPLCLLILRRSRATVRAVAISAAVLAAASGLLAVGLYDELEGTARVYFGTDTRAAAVLLGAALAGGLRVRVPAADTRHRLLDAAGVAALVGLGWAWASADGETPWVYRGGLQLCGLLATCVIAAAVVAERGVIARLFAFAPLRHLGLVSYGLYLWHWPLFLVFTPDRTGLDGAALASLRIAVSIGFALASYHFLELPIRRGALSPRALTVAGTTAFAVTSAALFFATGMAETIPTPGPGDLLESALPPRDGRTRALVIGDSVAGGLGDMFDELVPSAEVQLVTRAFPGCSPMVSNRIRFGNGKVIGGEFCDQAIAYWRAAHAELSPDWVVLVDGLPGEWDRELEGAWHHPCDPVYDARFVRDLVSFFRSLEGTQLAIVLMPPREKFDALRGEDKELLVPLARERMACQNAARRAAADALGATLLDLDERVCPGERCGAVSRALRPDGLHYYAPDGLPVAKWLVAELEEAARSPRGPVRGSTR